MRLAWRQGRGLSELLAVLPAWEVPYWMAFERLEGPIGPEREDLQAAQTPATVLGLFTPRGKPRPTAADLAPDWGGEMKARRKRKAAKAWVAYAKRLAAEKELRESEGG